MFNQGRRIMKLARVIIALFMGLCLVLALGQPALAGLRVVGAKIEAEVSPGSSNAYEMNVGNTSDAPMDIVVEVRGYATSATNSFIALEPEKDTSQYSARKFLTASPSSFHLEPGESQDIVVTAKIPADVGDGGRYAIVFIHTMPSGTGTATITAIAARVLLTIKGSNLIHDSEVTPVSLGDIIPGEPLQRLVTITNNGNHHYKPYIQGTLRKGDKILATASIKDDWPIIPGYSRQFQLNFVGEASIPAGEYKVNIEVKDESGNLVTEGTFPVEFTEKQEVLPPEKAPLPPEPSTAAPLITALLPPSTAINWPVIVGAIAAVVIVGLLIVIFLLLRRKRAH